MIDKFELLINHEDIPAIAQIIWVLILFSFITIVILSMFCKSVRRSLYAMMYSLFSRFGNRNFVKYAALIVWIGGTIIYMIGFYYNHEHYFPALFLHASMSSLEMFLSHSDLLEVAGCCHKDWIYMTIFMLIHFFAILLSAGALLHFFSNTIKTYLKISEWENLKGNKFYIFNGINEISLLLAESLHNKDEKSKIIFISKKMEDVHGNHRLSFSHLLNLNFNKKSNLQKVEAVGGVILQVEFPFKKNVLSDWKVKKIRRIMSLNQVDVFFLSDSDVNNMKTMLDFLDDSSESGILQEKNRIHIYCHARNNNRNRLLIKEKVLHYNINLVDSSYLSIFQLKKNVNYHPVQYIEGNKKKGCVNTPFVAMVIGFGETGQDAFRFLYEFGSFVNESGKENLKSIYVVDEKLDTLKTDFLENAPALKDKSINELDWWNVSTHSNSFWDRMNGIVNQLNYVVIAVDNDKEAMDISLEIFEFACRYRNNLEKFGIFVRVKHSKELILMKNMSNSSIIPFGADNEVFSYDTISVDVDEKRAKAFYYQYNKKEIIEEDISDSADEEWEKRRSKFRDKNLSFLDRYKAYVEICCKEEQDKANVWHIETKRALADECNEFTLDNLSACEHLRWNACMELQGFTLGDENEKDYLRRKHYCLIDWLDLKNKYKDMILCDQNVVKYSFGIINDDYGCGR